MLPTDATWINEEALAPSRRRWVRRSRGPWGLLALGGAVAAAGALFFNAAQERKKAPLVEQASVPGGASRSLGAKPATATLADTALSEAVRRDIQTHPVLKSLGLRVDVVSVENGYVTLALLNGPAGLPLELTGVEWSTVALPSFEFQFPPWASRRSNVIVELAPSVNERMACAQACASLAAAIQRNPACKGVFWREVPAARARRLFVEAGIIFFTQECPPGKAVYDAYEDDNRKEWMRTVSPPGILAFLEERALADEKDWQDILVSLWSKPELTQYWMACFLQEDERKPLWFLAYREAWMTPEFWDTYPPLFFEASPGKRASAHALEGWRSLETAMRIGTGDDVVDAWHAFVLTAEKYQRQPQDRFEVQCYFSIALPLTSLASTSGATNADHENLWQQARKSVKQSSTAKAQLRQ